MKTVNLIFPNQLFEDSELLTNDASHYIIEEFLFFNQYNFHKQKIYFHRCTMKNYFDYLKSKGLEVHYVESQQNISDIRNFILSIDTEEIQTIKCLYPEDNYLKRRITDSCSKKNIDIQFFNNPLFINSKKDLKSFFRKDKQKFFQTSFYKSERLRLNILIDNEKKPHGGKWTYDELNREKYPKNKKTPAIIFPKVSSNHSESLEYVEKYFKNNYGEISSDFIYPTDFKSAKKWWFQFLEKRFDEFGPYEDAVL